MSVERSTCAGREKGHNPQWGPLLEVTRCISHRIVRRARSTARRAGSSVYLHGMSLAEYPPVSLTFMDKSAALEVIPDQQRYMESAPEPCFPRPTGQADRGLCNRTRIGV